jgi:hypothetical protein
MSEFADFARRCRMRHDFADQIQVKYEHPSGERYDTWISGEEVLARLRSADAEARLRRLGKIQPGELGAAADEAKRAAKRSLRDRLRARLGDSVESLAGGNPLGDSLAESVRGKEPASTETEAARWQPYLHDEAFRTIALELAWIQLRGSFPEHGPVKDEGDWV